MIPHKDNFCGGNFQDWLEVMLTEKCNAHCSWCVEKHGWHPKDRADWGKIATAALDTRKKNIILLGGEPTLCNEAVMIIEYLHSRNRNVYITTNGYTISRGKFYGYENLEGMNLSIHHYDIPTNCGIIGIPSNGMSENGLFFAVEYLQKWGVRIRLNCNLIRGYIDSKKKIFKYIDFAKSIDVHSVRFAELKFDDENFVDLHEIFGDEYGLNCDPFTLGCNKNTTINGVEVNFRQMCGLQTSKRPKPISPEQCRKQVLYYDGKIYDGWQTCRKEESKMKENEITALLQQVKNGNISIERAIELIKSDQSDQTEKHDKNIRQESYGCSY